LGFVKRNVELKNLRKCHILRENTQNREETKEERITKLLYLH
jgi:hypothetical protein